MNELNTGPCFRTKSPLGTINFTQRTLKILTVTLVRFIIGHVTACHITPQCKWRVVASDSAQVSSRFFVEFVSPTSYTVICTMRFTTISTSQHSHNNLQPSYLILT